MSLHDPSANDASEQVAVHQAEAVSLEQLRAIARETEIDFTELTNNINALLHDLSLSPADNSTELAQTTGTAGSAVTTGDVLAAFPATQGVASLVGLLMIGVQHGTPTDSSELARWTGLDGVERQSLVPGFRFTERVL